MSTIRPNPLCRNRAFRLALLPALLLAAPALLPMTGLIASPALAQQVESALGVYNDAKALYDQGHYADALPLAERALMLADRQLPAGDERTATMHGLLGALYTATGRYGDAEAAYRSALDIRAAKYGETDPILGDTWHYLGVVQQHAGRFAEAEQSYRQGLDLRQRRYGAESEPVAEALTRLGLSIQQQDNLREAEPPLLRALEIRRQSANPDPAKVQESLGHLLALYVQSGRMARAEPMLKELIASQEARVGVEHPSVAQAKEQLAIVYQQLNRFDEAENLHREALAINEAVFGPQSLEVASNLYSLGALYGRMEPAEPFYARALAIQEAALDADDKALELSRLGLGRVYLEQERYDEALPLLEAAAGARASREGPSDPALAPILKDIALVNRGMGRTDRAVDRLREAASLEEVAGRDLARANTMADLAFVELSADRPERALRAQEQAVALFRRASGPETIDTARETAQLGTLHSRLGDHQAAVPLQREALAIRTKLLGSVHPDIADSQLRLARALHSSDRAAEAERHYRQALAVSESLHGSQSVELRPILRELASVLTDLGRPSEARDLELRAEALGQ